MSIIKPNNNTISAITALPAGIATGSMVLLNSQTASNVASVEFKHGTNDVVIDSTYIIYQIVGTDIESVNDGTAHRIELSTDAGSSYITSGYDTLTARLQAGADLATITDTSVAMEINALGNVAATEGADFIFTIFNPSNTKYTRYSYVAVARNDGAHTMLHTGGGILETAGDVDAIKCLQETGNILSGTFKLYGLKGS